MKQCLRRNRYQDGQGSGVYIKAGTVVAILEFEAEDGIVDKRNAHRAGGCNHIIDDRFTPTELNKQNPEEGGAYTFQGTQVKELKTTKHRVTTTVEPKHSAVRAKAISTLTAEDMVLRRIYPKVCITNNDS